MRYVLSFAAGVAFLAASETAVIMRAVRRSLSEDDSDENELITS